MIDELKGEWKEGFVTHYTLNSVICRGIEVIHDKTSVTTGNRRSEFRTGNSQVITTR